MNKYYIDMLSNEQHLEHHDVQGQKWGVTNGPPYPLGQEACATISRDGYKSTSLKGAIARHEHNKQTKQFQKWNEGYKQKEDAIAKGKIHNDAKVAYTLNPSKENKDAVKSTEKEFKQSFRKVTPYRKADAMDKLDRDAAAKYNKEANKVYKQLQADPTNKDLTKLYSALKTEHDINLAKAPKDVEKYENRGQLKANIKRYATITAKTAATTAAVAAGSYVIYKASNGEIDTMSASDAINTARSAAKTVGKVAKYF